jgi:hypothetical protein
LPLLRILVLATLLTGCVGQHAEEPGLWFAAHDGVAPRDGGRAVVCHGFGCHLKTAVRFSRDDLRRMARLIGRGGPQAEREGIRRMIAWAERRVAPAVGSADDVAGLDIGNAGKRGQMDCIDEATNTTSYLLVAQQNGLLRHHTVARPVARGFFLDGRYPHATAVIVDPDGTPWAVDSWPQANGRKPDVMPLSTWFERSPAS